MRCSGRPHFLPSSSELPTVSAENGSCGLINSAQKYQKKTWWQTRFKNGFNAMLALCKEWQILCDKNHLVFFPVRQSRNSIPWWCHLIRNVPIGHFVAENCAEMAKSTNRKKRQLIIVARGGIFLVSSSPSSNFLPHPFESERGTVYQHLSTEPSSWFSAGLKKESFGTPYISTKLRPKLPVKCNKKLSLLWLHWHGCFPP